MWEFNTRTGIVGRDGIFKGRGYSGHEAGKNNPDLQQVPNVGPIPVGRWIIEDAHDSLSLGPLVMNLSPKLGTYTYGRSLFRIHGDSKEHSGEASHGCIILAHNIRQEIADSGDSDLEVTA